MTVNPFHLENVSFVYNKIKINNLQLKLLLELLQSVLVARIIENNLQYKKIIASIRPLKHEQPIQSSFKVNLRGYTQKL